jgi:hypothetical protein
MKFTAHAEECEEALKKCVMRVSDKWLITDNEMLPQFEKKNLGGKL